jgi:hypothetical protein
MFYLKEQKMHSQSHFSSVAKNAIKPSKEISSEKFNTLKQNFE